MRARNIVVPLLIIACLVLLAAPTLWRWTWTSGYHARANCRLVADAAGSPVEAWRWVESRHLDLYLPWGLAESRKQAIAGGVRGLIDELELDITVTVRPINYRITRALEDAAAPTYSLKSVDFTRFSALLLASRERPCAEMVVAPYIIGGSWDTLGMASFNTGTALITEQCASANLARHETGHLLGYALHDAHLPHAFDFAFDPRAGRGDGTVDNGATLMTPHVDGTALSPQSRTALVSFWRGLEQRTGQRFFTPTVE
jgi:hypothetical protein